MTTTFKYRYPGDPVSDCELMDRQEFLSRFPREGVQIWCFEDQKIDVELIPQAPDEIACDFCSDDPGNEIYLIDRGHKVICAKCAGRSVLPHRLGNKS